MKVGVRLASGVAVARQIQRLSARTVQTLKSPGRHADGAGLYLIIDTSGSKRWAFIYRDRKTQKLREMGLGGLQAVSLAQARDKATEVRASLAGGVDPIAARREAERDRGVPTFSKMAELVIESMSPTWRNPKHRDQWEMTTTRYCKDIADTPVDQISTDDVLKILQPVWQRIPETAGRLRGRIEKILDAAKAKGYRSGENPARWRGHLDHLLPARAKLTRGHHAAMPFQEVPEFIARLREQTAIAPLALEFAILTAARTGEVLGASWEEIDLDKAIWTVPAGRMKAARVHRVPLSKRAVAILAEMRKIAEEGYVFPGQQPSKPLSSMSLIAVLRRMKLGHFTPHGFRSAFRDWCGECTSFPREVAEAALAHTLSDKTEAAYRRGDALEKRRKLMEAWANHCQPQSNKNVVALRRSGN